MSTPPSPSPALTEAPVIAQVTRSGFVECLHRGTVVVTGTTGAVELAIGDPSGPVYPRSSTKPVQLVAMVRAGLATSGPHLSIGAASHSGEAFHLQAVREILQGAGLAETDLQNTPDYPYDEAARIEWIAEGRPKSSIAQNCSGKHASMLATCVAAGWDTATYRDPEHPLQRAITAEVEALTGEQVVAIGVDGCGAPIHAVPLSGLARAFGRIAAATDGPERAVADAIRAHPEYLGGSRRDVTEVIRGLPGAIAKDGAEAVYAVGLPDGRGIALKIADGGQRARTVVLAAVLRRLGYTETDAGPALAALEHADILGHGKPVGSVSAVGI